jgi:hypothetical protein
MDLPQSIREGNLSSKYLSLMPLRNALPSVNAGNVAIFKKDKEELAEERKIISIQFLSTPL